MTFRDIAINYIIAKKIEKEGKKITYTTNEDKILDTIEIDMNVKGGLQKKIVIKTVSKRIEKYIQLVKQQEVKAFYRKLKKGKKISSKQHDAITSIADDLIINSKAEDLNSFLDEFKKMTSEIIQKS